MRVLILASKVTIFGVEVRRWAKTCQLFWVANRRIENALEKMAPEMGPFLEIPDLSLRYELASDLDQVNMAIFFDETRQIESLDKVVQNRPLLDFGAGRCWARIRMLVIGSETYIKSLNLWSRYVFWWVPMPRYISDGCI